MIYCGIDWAENHHDVALVDDSGQLLAKARITDDMAGYRQLLDLLAQHGDAADSPIPVAIETNRGLLVATLRSGPRSVYAINPLAAARYRDRHSVSRKKSDLGDALVLANILRTDAHAHRAIPDDSDLVASVAVLARAQQDAVWNRQQIANQLRSLLREYYPAVLQAASRWKGGLCRPESLELLKAAPTPTSAARLTRAQITAALKKAGRQRGIEAETERLREIFRAEWAHHQPLTEQAMGRQMLALLRQLEAACLATDDLAQAAEEAFLQHEDAEIILSFPGLFPQLGARVLAEIGDDRTRFASARGLRAHAGSSPVTRASGKKAAVAYRRVKNQRLNHAGYLWSFSALCASPGVMTRYRHRRDVGDWHASALRNVFNGLVGQLHHCLRHRQLFDEHAAFRAETDVLQDAA